MNKKKHVLGHNIECEGNVPGKDMKKAINLLKGTYRQRVVEGVPVLGFEINGGSGLTGEAIQLFDKFKLWVTENKMDVEYSTVVEMERMAAELKTRVNTNKGV